MKIRFTQEDLDRGKIVTPGWYAAQVLSCEEKPADTDGSMNWNFKLQIVEGDFKGVPVWRTFNEKGKGYAARFVEALGGKVAAGVEFDPQKSVGRRLKIFIKNGMWQGNMRNEVADFMLLDGAAPSTTPQQPQQ